MVSSGRTERDDGVGHPAQCIGSGAFVRKRRTRTQPRTTDQRVQNHPHQGQSSGCPESRCWTIRRREGFLGGEVAALDGAIGLRTPAELPAAGRAGAAYCESF
jgi:hypothetical protein